MTVLAALALALQPAPQIQLEPVSSSPSLYERMGLQAVKNGADWVLLGGFDYPTRTCLREVSVLTPSGVERTTKVRLAVGRNHFRAHSLGQDRVLVVGGYSEAYETLASVECVNLRTGASEAWPWLPDPAELFTSHCIGNRIALIGGLVSQGKTRTLSSIQWIDLKTHDAVRATESLATSRFGHASLVLKSGEVVIVGGKHVQTVDGKPEYSAVDSIEIWDPKLGKVRPGGKLTIPRDRPALVELGNGKVLVIGGTSDTAKQASIELYDPSTGTSQVVASMSTPRMAPMILPVANQGVLIAGGWVDDPDAGRAIEYLDFAHNTCTIVGKTQATRAEAAMIWLTHTEFALVGGKDAFANRDPHAYSFKLTERFRMLPPDRK